MGDKSKIEWCDATWNPVQGCTPISPGCKNCYARGIAERFRGTPGHPYEYGFDVRFFPDRLSMPLKWKKPKNIFVCSMADLFHDDVSDEIIERVFIQMVCNRQHVFFVLTKRPERMAAWLEKYRTLIDNPNWLCSFDHIWFGVSVEDEQRMERLKILSGIEGIKRFVSFEPLVGEIRFDGWESYLAKMKWIICGAETGAKARPISYKTVSDLFDVANIFFIPFFFKKWGNKEDNGWMPREFPEFRKGEK